MRRVRLPVMYSAGEYFFADPYWWKLDTAALRVWVEEHEDA